VSGALTELIKTYNWQQGGAVTVDEAVARMQTMVNGYYAGCISCDQPGGFRVIRVGAGGHVEELDGDGNYVPATGDYAVAPIPAREGGTSEDQICLAAANAENVLHEVYLNIAESFAGGLSEAEALTALVEFLIVTLGAEFAPITYALALLILSVFGIVYSAVAYLTADLWDSNFTKAFKCTLVNCASNDSGVVTFDWDCVEHSLYAAATTFGINETQLRLYAQINYILAFIGGADALNTAGANTGITEADCTDCGATWCRNADFTAFNLDGWTLLAGTAGADGIVGEYAHWTYRPDIDSSSTPGYGTVIGIERTITIPVNDLQALFDFSVAASHADGQGFRFKFGAYNGHGDYDLGEHQVPLLTIEAGTDVTGTMQLWIWYGFAGTPGDDDGDVLLKYLRLNGVGENPIDVDNCFA